MPAAPNNNAPVVRWQRPIVFLGDTPASRSPGTTTPMEPPSLLVLLAMLATLVRGACPADNCSGVGCRKPAPPPCCPGTCPRCLPVGQRRGAGFRNRSASLPVSIRRDDRCLRNRPRRTRTSPLERRAGRVLLDEQDFYRLDGWAVPAGECTGPDCACANCVCCFTETLLFSVTETCSVTEVATTFETSTFTSLFGLTAFASVTNTIIFTVTNALEYISTVVFETTDTRNPLTLLFTQPQTVSVIQTLFLATLTERGIVGTALSFFNTTVTIFVPFTTTATASLAVSLATPFTVSSTRSLATATSTDLISYEIFKCARTLTATVDASATVTPTIPVTETLTPTATWVDFTVTTTGFSTGTLTATRCTGFTTVRFTPVRTIKVLATPVPTADPFPPLRCPCAQG